MSDRNRPTYLKTFGEFASTATLATLSDAARERARWIVADCIPVIAAGMQQPEMKAFVAKRPVYTVLNTSKLTTLIGEPSRSWQSAVEDFVTRSFAPGAR